MFRKMFSQRSDYKSARISTDQISSGRIDRLMKRDAATEAVKESVSVVLRRQIPVRVNEETHSWLGGLPCLPNGMQWPRSESSTPLHFISQIDCASLPQELWGGLGPREGWLLLFIDFEAIDDEQTTIAQILHVTELGEEAAPPSGLYFARRDVGDISGLPEIPDGAQRQHFRKWPIDLVLTAADTSELTGSELYSAPENEYSLSALDDFEDCRPTTWRGVCTLLAGLIKRYDAKEYKQQWTGNAGGLIDYPEPDINDFNKVWHSLRVLPEWSLNGSRYPDDTRLRAHLHEERRSGWTQRAFKVLDEETEITIRHLNDYRTKLAAAISGGNEDNADSHKQSVEYFEKQLKDRHEHRSYLRDLFAKYPSEATLVKEINRVGRAHLEWAQQTQNQLRVILRGATQRDLDSQITAVDWDAILSVISSMKSTYWIKTYETDLLRKVERSLHVNPRNIICEEVLDHYVSPTSPNETLNSSLLEEIEPRLRHLESGKPHKMGGLIDSYYENPMEDSHVLLFQIASDEATGWICGDLGFVYVSILASDLKAGRFDKVKSWLEA